MLNFDTSSFEITIANIKGNITRMEDDVIDSLKDFVREMPDYKSRGLRLGTPAEYNFWKNITGQSKDKLEIDDILEYLSKNYNEKAMDETARNALLTSIGSIREGTIEVIRQNAKDLIAEQKRIVEQNREIIKEEEKQHQKVVEDLEKLEEEKIELEAEKLALEESGKDETEIIAKVIANEEKSLRLQKKKDRFESDVNDSIANHKLEQAQFEKEIINNEKELRVLFRENNINLEDKQPQATPNTQSQAVPSNTQQLPVLANASQNKKITNNMSAKQKLKILRNAPNKKEMLDDMGYGDVAEMIEELEIGRAHV